jgi:hypothetical protein
MKSYSLSVVVSLAFAAASASAAPTLYPYNYSVRTPATGISCEEAAQNLAQKVQAAAPQAVHVQGSCLARVSFADNGEHFAMDNLRVSYEATSPLSLNTTQLPNYDFNVLNLYPKYSDCLNDLAPQTSLYIQATGLSPLAATCIPASDSYSGYTLKIDAAGKPARVLHSMHSLSWARLDENAGWNKQVLDFIAQSGAMIAKAQDNQIAYYAPIEVAVSTLSWLHTETQEQCETQFNEVSSMLKKLGAKNTLVACHANGVADANYKPNYYLDSVNDAYLENYYMATYGQTFFTYEECMDVRRSILDREPNAKAWLGSFCSLSDYSPDRYILKTVTHY